ncbi:MAG TPA: LysR family transcriptional regulator [Burkholderiales bacterium]|nr:LysR family transcriptional regulator [Burkholderiales bacterium]
MFRRLDLNLLTVLEVILSEGSVTQAARRLNLAQPTVSNALARLREHFRDQLLERSGRTMTLTPKARELVHPLREALAKLQAVLEGEPRFEPQTATGVIRVVASDYIDAVLLPKLTAHLATHAPKLRLVVSDFTSADPMLDLKSGHVDLVIGAFNKTSPDIHRYDLFTDDWVCVARKGHPGIKGRITVKQFRECAQIAVRPQNGSVSGSIDDILMQTASRRNLRLSVPHLFSALKVVLEADVLLTLAARTAAMLGPELPVQVMKHPLQLKPFVISQLWHERTHQHPAHAWFRKVLAESCAGESGAALSSRRR